MKNLLLTFTIFTVLTLSYTSVDAQSVKKDVRKEYKDLLYDIKKTESTISTINDKLEIFDRAKSISSDITQAYGCRKKSKKMILTLAVECRKLV